MKSECKSQVAIVYPGDEAIRRNATPENNRFASLFRAFADRGIKVEPVVYNDDFCDEVREQLIQVQIVLVWINPIEGGRDRTRLDAMLRDVAQAGVFVSAHPDVILKIGTKEVLYQTRGMTWGGDTHLYRTLDQMKQELPLQLDKGPRVLKQYRGHSGMGVWKVEWKNKHGEASGNNAETLLRVRHAMRGSVEEAMTFENFLSICTPYFAGGGRMIDQEYRERLPEGMIRCYLAHGRVAGFGHQAINALYPAALGTLPQEAPQPGPRLYHPATMPEFQLLRHQLEEAWVPELQQLLHIDTHDLPILWDCDFLLGSKDSTGQDSYVLCEINASSVAPFPDSAVETIVEATISKL